MHKTFITCCALILASAANGASSEPVTIYGIKMLMPISIPECAAFADPVKWRKKYRTAAYPYAPPTTSTCYRRGDRSKSGTSEPLAFDTLELQFLKGREPALGYGVNTLVIDGKVHAIKWSTRGVAQQELVFASLKDKFGVPAAFALETKQNGFGAEYKSIRASWKPAETVTVVFEGVGGQVNQGSVAVMSDLARVRVTRELSKSDTSTPL